MKVLKDIEHGVLFSAFGLGGKWYFQAAVSLFFPLGAPDELLPEKELWQCAARWLPSGVLLDAGYPKPSGEFLAAGACFAPNGSAPAGRVAIRVGEISRELLVFGDRKWVQGPAGPAPGPAQPFSQMPLDWAHAFGGPGFAENPHGKGAQSVSTPWGETIHPLPNVEDPTALIGAPTDTPAPASFLPVPYDTPSRRKLAGTYDDHWKRTRWPGFPDDLDTRFFNTASPGQILAQGFFRGAEPVVVEGMHPTRPVLEGRLPKKRVRVFLTRIPDPRKPQEARFEEVPTRLETVWLFPAEERAAVLYRLAVETVDDEYSDIARLFVAVEDADAPPQSIEFYRDEQARRLMRAPEIDPDLMADAKTKIDTALRQVRTIAQDVQEGLDVTLGKAPSIAMPPQARFTARIAQVRAAIDHVDTATARLREVKAKYGHLVKIDVRMFDSARSKLAALIPVIEEAAAKHAQTTAERARAHAELLAHKDRGVPPKVCALRDAALREQGIDPATLKPFVRPEDLWQRAAMALIAEAQQALMAEPGLLAWLERAGLRRNDIQRLHLGLIPETRSEDPSPWGLSTQELPPEMGDKLTLGPGLLVPYFEAARCVRLTLRSIPDSPGPDDLPPALPCPEAVVPGSTDGVLTWGAGAGRPILLCSDPLVGRLCFAEAGDAYAVVVCTSPAAAFPDEVAALLKEAPLVLMPLAAHTAPSEEAARAITVPYRAAIPNLQPYVAPQKFPGPTLFAARAQGLDVRAWLLEPLQAQGLPAPPPHGVTLPDAPGKKLALAIPKIDVSGIVISGRQRAKAEITAQNIAIGLREQMMEETRAMLARQGMDPTLVDQGVERALATPAPSGPDPDILSSFEQTKAHLAKQGLLTAERKATLEASKEEYIGIATRLGQVREKGLANLEAAKARAANPIPAWAAQKMGALCLEGGKRAASVDTILAHLAAGGSLAGVDLSGMDFRGRDLSGVDFSKAILRGTNFAGANLDGARLHQVLGGETIFTEASLRGALLTQAVLTGSDFTDADLTGTHCTQSELSKCRFVRTVLHETVLDKTQLSQAEFSQTQVEGASFRQCIMRAVTITDTHFRKANVTRSLFDRARFTNATFEGGSVTATTFTGCTGEKIRFLDADCTNLRLLRETTFPRATFHQCTLDTASFREAALPGATFVRSTLHHAAIHSCDLTGADLSGCRAQNARIRKTDLTGAKLVRTDLHGASLRKSRLVQTDFTAANCYGVDFFRTVFHHTRMTGANLRRSLIEEYLDTMHEEEMIR